VQDFHLHQSCTTLDACNERKISKQGKKFKFVTRTTTNLKIATLMKVDKVQDKKHDMELQVQINRHSVNKLISHPSRSRLLDKGF